MKEKLKKLDFKHILLVCALTLFIGLLVLCFVLLNNLDKNNYKKNFYSSDISYVNDNLNVYLNDSSFRGGNSLVFKPLNYYEYISVEDLIYDPGVFGEGYCDVGCFYITNQDLLYAFREAEYLNDSDQPYFYLNFSLDYLCTLLEYQDSYSFNVPLWVDFNGSYYSDFNSFQSFLVSNRPSYTFTSFVNDNLSYQYTTTIDFSIDITDYFRTLTYIENPSSLPLQKICFYFLTRVADASYTSSDKTFEMKLDYEYHNLFNYNDYFRENYILDGSNYNINNSFNCFKFDLSNGNYTLSGFSSGYYVNVSSTSSDGTVISTLLQTNSRSAPFTFTLASPSTIVICVENSISSLIMFNSGPYSLPYQSYHNFDSFAFSDWCSSHHLSLSNSSFNSNLDYDSLSNRYNDLLNDYNSLNNDYNSLNNDYNSLNANYTTLLDQYNALASGEYTFSELFWSVSAVPFGVLTSAFNVDVLGVNLRGIITGLFTALLIIWLIKKLF